MSLSAGNQILATDIKNLKAKVKAECARRKYTGSVAGYAGTSYDYTTVPAPGGAAKEEHIKKIIEPMNAIKATGYTSSTVGTSIKALNTIDANVTTYAAESITASKSSCASSCTGLCVNCTGSCTGSCTGCSGRCSGSCSGGCDDGGGGCGIGCYGDCEGGCGGCGSSYK